MRIANRVCGSRWFLVFGLGAMAVAGLGSGLHVILRAQDEPEEVAPTPELPSKLENPSLRLQRASSLVQKLTESDAAFEVILGQSRTLVLEKPLEFPEDGDEAAPSVAISDQSVADVLLVGARQLRILGRRVGTTDLTINTGNGELITFEIRVGLDLRLLEARLRQVFPDASVQLAHLGNKLLVEGEARDAQQLARINEVLQKAVQSASAANAGSGGASQVIAVLPDAARGIRAAARPEEDLPEEPLEPGEYGVLRQVSRGRVQEGDEGAEQAVPVPGEKTGKKSAAGNSAAGNDAFDLPNQKSGGAGGGGTAAEIEIINLMRIPGPQQVMLMVQIAELNRTAYRQIGSDLLFADSGNVIGTRMTGATGVTGTASGTGVFGSASASAGGGSASTTAFGIFEGMGFQAFISALRRNSVLKVLAEPNLVAMHGHRADFLAGGEFPVPVPQSGAGGGTPTVTIQYKKFGVQLAFVPYVLDGDLIRMEVDPEVSSIDYSLGTQVSGVSVPGLNTRRSHTTVEMREGQTLAIAGLMQVDLAGRTDRIPGMGDLPYIGPFFSNTTNQRVEKELIVLVTPHLVAAVNAEELGPLPGAEVYEPNDLEFYLLNRIEGHTGHAEFRSTTNGEDPLGCFRKMQVESSYIQGPHGFSE
jgi:pilus assembly protein CpaC